MLPVPFFKQAFDYTCGAACVRMVLGFAGIVRSEEALVKILKPDPVFGTPRSRLVGHLRTHGLICNPTSRGTKDIALRHLAAGRPMIVNYLEPEGEGHYAVLIGWEKGIVTLHDPWHGAGFRLLERQFLKRWLGHNTDHPDGGWLCAVRDGKR